MMIKIGSIVCYNGVDGIDNTARGRVVQKVTVETSQAVEVWWDVRWFGPDGKPDGGEMRLGADELCEVPQEAVG